MNFILTENRQATMRERLGKACDLIDNERFLGVFRNRQINFEKEFNQSVKMVKEMRRAGKIKNAQRYFAKIWKKENIPKTLKIIREFLARQSGKLAEKRENTKRNLRSKSIVKNRNEAGLSRLQMLKKAYSLS